MSNYLVVAHQTATSPELLRRASEIADRDSGALFTLLVPATPVVHLLTWEEGETQEVARLRAAEAKQRFESSALRVEAAKVGDASPMLAIEDELRKNPGKYDAIVLSTLPPGFFSVARHGRARPSGEKVRPAGDSAWWRSDQSRHQYKG